MLLTPPSLRSKVSEQPDRLRISIPAPRSASTALFLLFWLVMWGYAEKRVGTSIISGKQQNLFDIAWFGFWTFGGGCVMYAWLWNLFGRDIVTVGAGELRLRSEIAGVGRDRRFQIDDIHNLRFIPEYGAGRGHREAQIAFDFGAKTIKFAGSIEEPEANRLIAMIRTRTNITDLPSFSYYGSSESGSHTWLKLN